MPISLGVIMGGWGFEREENMAAGASVAEALLANGHELVVVDVQRVDSLAEIVRMRDEGVSFAFLCTTEELPLQFILENMSIEYSGSGISTSVAYYDKWLSHLLLSQVSVPVPPTWLISKSESVSSEIQNSVPLVIKPRRGGASVGISVVREPKRLQDSLKKIWEFDSFAVAQPKVLGHEYTAFYADCQLLCVLHVGGPDDVWTHAAKRRNSQPFEACSDATVCQAFAKIGLAIAETGVRGVTRLDARDCEGNLLVLDVNTSPYIGGGQGTSVSAMCRAMDMTYYQFLRLVYTSSRSDR